MLSQNSTCATYIVFKTTDESYGLDYCVQEASVSIGRSKSTHEVWLQGYGSEDEDEGVLLPQKRGDGWMELELGQFYNDR
uniref:Uncharacterized protein n=1 Tax=Arundo donax TaxID=35708 RepID=A0A0A9BDX1_ARUDO